MAQDITQKHIKEIYKEENGNNQGNNLSSENIEEIGQAGLNEDDENRDSEEYVIEQDEKDELQDFLHEQIKKDRGIKTWWKFFKYVVIGIVIGAVACIVFYLLSPWAKKTFTHDDKVSIPLDSEPIDETYIEIREREVIEEVPMDLDIDSVKQYSAALRDVANEANHSMVTIIGSGDLSGWFDGTYVDPGSASGVIVAETGTEVLILAPAGVINKSEGISVVFSEGSEYPGHVKMIDNNTGLAVISVNISDISTATLNYHKIAVLGNSYASLKGSDVIILGSPFGFKNGEVFGTLTGKNGTSGVRDGFFEMLITNISGADNESGAIFNTSGEVIGFITPDAFSSNSSVIAAFSISQIKAEIEMLSNGIAIPYMGIKGVDIDEKTAKDQGMEQGILVTDVELDSPAMKDGLQNGDIIRYMNKEEVLSMVVFREKLLSYSSGEAVQLEVARLGANGYEPVLLAINLGSK